MTENVHSYLQPESRTLVISFPLLHRAEQGVFLKLALTSSFVTYVPVVPFAVVGPGSIFWLEFRSVFLISIQFPKILFECFQINFCYGGRFLFREQDPWLGFARADFLSKLLQLILDSFSARCVFVSSSRSLVFPRFEFFQGCSLEIPAFFGEPGFVAILSLFGGPLCGGFDGIFELFVRATYAAPLYAPWLMTLSLVCPGSLF